MSTDLHLSLVRELGSTGTNGYKQRNRAYPHLTTKIPSFLSLAVLAGAKCKKINACRLRWGMMEIRKWNSIIILRSAFFTDPPPVNNGHSLIWDISCIAYGIVMCEWKPELKDACLCQVIHYGCVSPVLCAAIAPYKSINPLVYSCRYIHIMIYHIVSVVSRLYNFIRSSLPSTPTIFLSQSANNFGETLIHSPDRSND